MADDPTTHEVTFTSADGTTLAGELMTPSGRAEHLVVLHQGSTLCDRDGQVPRVRMRSNLYEKLARQYAARGVASFRFDKRQFDRPRPEPLDYTLTHRVEDLEAAWHAAVGHDAAAGMTPHLVGHSEGGVIAQLAAVKLAEAGQEIRSISVLASPAVPLLDSMIWRARLALQEGSPKHRRAAEAAIAANHEWRRRIVMKEDYTLESFEAFLDYYTPVGGTQGWESWSWVKEHATLEIQKTTVRLPCRAFFVHGDHDRLVDVENLSYYRQSAERAMRTDMKFETMKNLGHYLEDSTRKAFVVSEPLADRVIRWVTAGS